MMLNIKNEIREEEARKRRAQMERAQHKAAVLALQKKGGAGEPKGEVEEKIKKRKTNEEVKNRLSAQVHEKLPRGIFEGARNNGMKFLA